MGAGLADRQKSRSAMYLDWKHRSMVNCGQRSVQSNDDDVPTNPTYCSNASLGVHLHL